MGITSTTPNISLNIIGQGTTNWGTIVNQNYTIIDSAFGADRARLTALETTNAVLPVALSNKIGSNLVRNSIFALSVTSDPSQALQWLSVFQNGATGYTTRDSSTVVVGQYSQRVSIVSVNIANQVRPFPGLNILDPVTQAALATNDNRQLLSGFGYVYQSIPTMLPNTIYTLSAYGKAEIPNNTLGINVRWKLAIIFRDTSNNIIESYVTPPQTNTTSDTSTASFARAQLTFTTPNLPTVQGEIWLIAEGATPSSIGSVFFDAVQVEQAAQATFFEAFSLQNGSLFIDGDVTVGGSLVLQQDQLVFATNKVIFSGNMQIGSDVTQDVLDVYTKIATFYGPVDMQQSVVIGSNPTTNTLQVNALTTTLYTNQNSVNPVGGNLVVQGSLTVDGNTTLGSNSSTDTVTINANLTAGNNLTTSANLTVLGAMIVDRAVTIGTNQSLDGFIVQMTGLGTDFYGDVRLRNNATVYGNTTLGTGSSNTLTANVGSATITGALTVNSGLSVTGPILLNIGTGSGDNLTITANNITVNAAGTTNWTTSAFTLSSGLTLGQGAVSQSFQALVPTLVLGYPSTANTNTLTVNAQSSTFTGNINTGGSVTIGTNATGTNATGTLTVAGNSFVFGTGLGVPRPYVSFQPVLVPGSINNLGQPSLGGLIQIGDPGSIQLVGGRKVFASTATFNAGTTYFGNPTTPGAETVGDVYIGGNLKVGGNTALGNSATSPSDTVSITAYSVDMNVGAGLFTIGTGYQGNTYNPSNTVHGGTTFDNNGNVFMDGYLTVKGPIDPCQLLITADGYDSLLPTPNKLIHVSDAYGNSLFLVDGSGNTTIAGAVSIGNGSYASFSATSATFGSALTPLTSYSVYSPSVFTGAMIVNGAMTTNSITSTGSVSITGNLTVVSGASNVFQVLTGGSIVALGSNFTFGTGTSSFNIEGNLTVTGNTTLDHSVTIGSGLSTDTLTVTTSSVNFNTGSGVYFNGGYLDNITYNSNALDHGGVTIDAYGNVFVNGNLLVGGSIGYYALTLTAPVGDFPANVLFKVVNDSYGATVFDIDNFGDTNTDGYVTIRDTFTQIPTSEWALTAPVSRTRTDGYAMLRVINTAQSATVFEVDNFGDIIAPPGGSTLAPYSVTVGDGYTTHGDFNLTGYNASSNPIAAAITYIAGTSSPQGTVFIKRGTYNLPVGLTLSPGISLQGEGEGTIITGNGRSGTMVGISCSVGSHISNLSMQNFGTAISVSTSVNTFPISDARVIIENNLITECGYGTVVDVLAGTANNIVPVTIAQNSLRTCTIGLSMGSSGSIVSSNNIIGDASTTMTGINVTGNECIVIGNYVVNHTISGIVLSGSNIVATGNVVLRNPT